MKNPITHRTQALLVGFGLVLATVLAGCSSIIAPPNPNPCFCVCTNGGGFDDSSGGATPGSTLCESNCRAGGTPEIICNDAVATVLPPPSSTPACPAGDTFATYAFCETCTGFIPFDRQIDASGCTEADALATVQKVVDGDSVDEDDDCNVELCKGE